MMRTKMLLVLFTLFAVACPAQETFSLKTNMQKLDEQVATVRNGMIRNNIGTTLQALRYLKKDVRDLLSNKSKIESLLPEAKKRKSFLALEAAKRIDENIEVIEDAFTKNKNNLSLLKRRAAAQRAYTYIEMACFHCHNMVRDQ